jgi:hypothetical protein
MTLPQILPGIEHSCIVTDCNDADDPGKANTRRSQTRKKPPPAGGFAGYFPGIQAGMQTVLLQQQKV